MGFDAAMVEPGHDLELIRQQCAGDTEHEDRQGGAEAEGQMDPEKDGADSGPEDHVLPLAIGFWRGSEAIGQGAEKGYDVVDLRVG